MKTGWFGDQGSGSGCGELGFGVWGLGSTVWGLGAAVQVSDSGFLVERFRFRGLGLSFMVSG